MAKLLNFGRLLKAATSSAKLQALINIQVQYKHEKSSSFGEAVCLAAKIRLNFPEAS
jgi:hypothetical protein